MKRRLARLPRRLVPLGTSLPLLRKELTEQGLSGRTFLLRAAFALILFLVFAAVCLPSVAMSDLVPSALFGIGAFAFDAAVKMLAGGVFLFLPALVAGVVQAERDRGSLELLWITRLTPGEILLEKYLSRILLMLTLLLVALPVFAFAYAFGGITTHQMALASLALVLTCLEVGAIALMFSARCRTATRALIGTYACAGLLYLGGALVAAFVSRSVPTTPYFLLPLAVYFRSIALGESFATVVVQWIPSAVVTGVFLLLAHRHFTRGSLASRRAMRPERQKVPLRPWIYRRRQWARRIPGLPVSAPVAWREVGRRVLGRPGRASWTRFQLVIGVAVAAFVFSAPAVHAVLWIVAATIVVLAGAGAAGVERQNQTLDLLLTTPLSGREIVLQKAQGFRRVIVNFLPLFFPAIALESLAVGSSGPSGAPSLFRMGAHIVLAFLAVVIFLSFLGYLSLWIGLRVKSGRHVQIAALITVFLWCVLPVALAIPCRAVAGPDAAWPDLVRLASPAFAIFLTHVLSFVPSGADTGMVVVGLLFFGNLVPVFRTLCLFGVDRRLGRIA